MNHDRWSLDKRCNMARIAARRLRGDRHSNLVNGTAGIALEIRVFQRKRPAVVLITRLEIDELAAAKRYFFAFSNTFESNGDAEFSTKVLCQSALQ